ncbi:MAG: ornithine cyclodeaminase family protein [Pseudomonadota bacterium]
MRFFDADAVSATLDYAGLIPALTRAHEADVDDVRSVVLEQPGSTGVDHFLALPAWQVGKAIGAKLVTVFPGNDKDGGLLPAIQAAYVLFDGTNGRPAAVIDGTVLTLFKTAADSGVGASFLARRDASQMLMVGAGALGPHLIRAHLAARPSITQVKIWNRTPGRAQALADRLTLPGVAISATEDLETTARTADVISCATMATEPLILGDWLKPGAHLDLVGSYQLDMRECDEDAVVRADVFVDSPWSAVDDNGEIAGALKSGVLTREQILANNFDFARGHHSGRYSDDQITLYKNGGGGHLDLMVAQILCPMGNG